MDPYTAICLSVFWIYYLTQVMSYYTYFCFSTFNVIHQMPPPIHPLEIVITLLIIGILLSFLCLISPSLLLGFVAYNAFEVYIRRYLPAMQLV